MGILLSALLLAATTLPAAAGTPSMETLKSGLQAPTPSADLAGLKAAAAKEIGPDGAEVPVPPAAELSCEEDPGAKLCRKSDYLVDLFGYECTGTACVGLWRMQTAGLKELYDLHAEHAKPGGKVKKEMGEKIKSLAADICRMSFTGAQPELFELTITINITMPKLKDLQDRAGLEKPKSCTFR